MIRETLEQFYMRKLLELRHDWGIQQKFRFESLCYGPKNCKLYKMGKLRSVPCKGDIPSYDEGWLDDICTERRGDDNRNGDTSVYNKSHNKMGQDRGRQLH